MGYEQKINQALRIAQADGEVLDSRRRALQTGDEIILDVPGQLFYRIIDMTPVLDPKAPPGLMTVHCASQVSFYAQRGQLNREFIRVRTAEEAGPMNVVALPDATTEQDV